MTSLPDLRVLILAALNAAAAMALFFVVSGLSCLFVSLLLSGDASR